MAGDLTRAPNGFNLPSSFGALPAFGRFRGEEKDCQLSARTDIEAIQVWLKESARRSKSTFESYRKEAERLCMWAASRNAAISGLTREDLADYDTFLRDPQPESLWVAKRRAPRADPDWRPFLGPLSAASRESTFNVLRSLYSYLHGTGYLRTNPLRRNKLGKDEDLAAEVRIRHRHLPEPLWAYLQSFLDKMPRESYRESMHALRCKWVLNLLYETGARRNEIANGKMGDFFRDGGDRYWLKLTGKGNKRRDVPVPNSLLLLCFEYREANGLPPLPGGEEDVPLVLSIAGKRGVGDEMLLKIVKKVCEDAADALESTDPQRAVQLRSATTHWVRHSKATHLMKTSDIQSVQEFLGHASIETTKLYQHIDNEELHNSIVGFAKTSGLDDK